MVNYWNVLWIKEFLSVNIKLLLKNFVKNMPVCINITELYILNILLYGLYY